MAYSTSERATAVARVLAGDSRRKVASEMGVSDSTVRDWVKQAESRTTAQERALAEQAESIAQRIERRQEEARDLLIARIVALASKEGSLRDATWAYGVLTDKALLAKGQPTAINEVRSHDQMDREIEQLMGEMAERARAGSS